MCLVTLREYTACPAVLIDYHGLGNLDNWINSISFSNQNFMNYVTQGLYALQAVGRSLI